MENSTSDGLAGIQYLKNLEAIDATKIRAIGTSQGGILAPMLTLKRNDEKLEKYQYINTLILRYLQNHRM